MQNNRLSKRSPWRMTDDLAEKYGSSGLQTGVSARQGTGQTQEGNKHYKRQKENKTRMDHDNDQDSH